MPKIIDGKLISTMIKDELKKEAISIILDSGYEAEYFDGIYGPHIHTEAIIKDDLVFAMTGETHRDPKGHTGFLFIYDNETKEILFLAKIVANDNYAIDTTYWDVVSYNITR